MIQNRSRADSVRALRDRRNNATDPAQQQRIQQRIDYLRPGKPQQQQPQQQPPVSPDQYNTIDPSQMSAPQQSISQDARMNRFGNSSQELNSYMQMAQQPSVGSQSQSYGNMQPQQMIGQVRPQYGQQYAQQLQQFGQNPNQVNAAMDQLKSQPQQQQGQGPVFY